MPSGVAQRSLFILLTFPIHSLWAYGSLDEFVAPDGSAYRENTVFSTDLIQSPTWNEQIDLYLCTSAASSYGSADVTFAANQQDELVSDIEAAIASWKDAGLGTSLDFGAVQVQNSDCGSGSFLTNQNGRNEIFFSTAATMGLDPSVLGFMIPYLEMQSGVLRIVEADIYITSGKTFYTADYLTANPGLNPALQNFSFQGVITHEIGHLLGLSHSGVTDDNSSDSTNTYATMFAAVGNLGHSISIATPVRDDISGIKTLYPTSNSFSGTQYGGSISGTVFTENGAPQRGAQVTAFSLSEKRTLASAFSGMRGTKGIPDGAFSIKGLPLDHPFILITEPLQRPAASLGAICSGNGVHPNFVYNVYNLPIATSLLNETEGYRSFAVEAYPDVNIVDTRAFCNTTSSPGISSAQSFTLTSAALAVSDLRVFVSNVFQGPNDAHSGNIFLQINPEDTADRPVITNANPLILDIEIGTDLSVLQNPQIRIVAESEGISNLDWASAIPSGSIESSKMTLSLLVPNPRPANRVYTVTASIEDDKYGSFTGSREIEIRNWTKNPNAGITYANGNFVANTSQKSSGGCQLREDRGLALNRSFIFISLSLFLLLFLRRLAKPKPQV